MKNEQMGDLSEGKLSTYIIGFVLSIVLTVIPFAIVMTSTLARPTVAIIIIFLAIVQILVHLVCFLHMKPSSEQSWKWMAFIYTVLLLFVLVGASIWIMYHLNHNMMMG